MSAEKEIKKIENKINKKNYKNILESLKVLQD